MPKYYPSGVDGCRPHIAHGFFGACEFKILGGISIGSAVLAQLTLVTSRRTDGSPSASIGNENVPKIIINNTTNSFRKTAIGILLISNHNSCECCLIKKLLPYVLFRKYRPIYILALEFMASRGTSTVPIVSAQGVRKSGTVLFPARYRLSPLSAAVKCSLGGCDLHHAQMPPPPLPLLLLLEFLCYPRHSTPVTVR